MVVVGAARGRSGGGGGGGSTAAASGPGDEGKVCSVAWQRQHMHHQQHNTKASIKLAAHGGEALPVVELKPFTRKVWRREKSLPNFYDRPVPKEDNGAETSRNAGKDPPPDIVRFIRELSDQRKTVDTRQSADSTQRYRSKLHPKTDFSFEGWSIAEHQQDLIPSFISRQERTKTMLLEDGVPAASSSSTGLAGSVNTGGSVTDRSAGNGAGGMVGREVSNLMAAYIRDKPLQQQQVCLTGDKLPMGNVGRRQLTYLNPFSAYRQKQAWNVLRSENSPSALSPRHNVSVSMSGRGSGVLAVSANGHLARHDLVLSGSSFHNPERALLQPLKNRQDSPHKFNNKLGAAQDALSLLSRTGAPTVLEKNLFFDQEVRLERCRREKSFAAVSETNILSSAHYVAYDSQPTLGEITLMKAREANKSRDGGKTIYRRNGLQKPLAALTSVGQNHLGRVYDNSPRSVKSEPGDSGILSSVGDTVDMAARPGDIATGYSRELAGEAIPEHPGDCEEPDDGSEEKRSTTLGGRGQEKRMAVPQADGGANLMESTDEYRRPLSDTAATDAVHVRNEQTPMSAENRARLLPRDDSYVGVDSDRQQTSHRKHREGFVREAEPSQDVIVNSSAQELTQIESGAETSSKDIVTGESIVKDTESSRQHSEKAESQQKKHEGRENDLNNTKTEADTTSLVNNDEDKAVISVTPAFQVIRSGSGHRDAEEAGSVRKLAQDDDGANGGSSGGHALIAQDMELVSVNSSAPSYGNVDSARDPVSQPPAEAAVPEQEIDDMKATEGQNGNFEGKISVSSVTGDDMAKEGIANTKQKNEEDKGVADQQQTAKADTGAVPEKPSDGGISDQPPAEDEQKLTGRTTGEEKDTQTDRRKSEQNLSIPLVPDGNSQQSDVLDSERNVAKTSRPQEEENSQENRAADGKVGEENATATDPASKQSIQTPSNQPEQHADENQADKSLSRENREPSTSSSSSLSSSDLGKDTNKEGNIQSDEKQNSGVEAIVTVTMENGDNFDGSKTFLTTTNVETEDWQNMVKV